LGSFLCMKSMEGMHQLSTKTPASIEQACCDTIHSPSITKILPNDLTPQPLLLWVAAYFVATTILVFQLAGKQFSTYPPLVPSFIRFSKGVVQRE
jgi:hypothetical protein